MRSLAGQTVVVDDTTAFYRDALQALGEKHVPVLVGGSHALVYYTGVARHTKDFDVFCRRSDVDRVLSVLAGIGACTEVPYPHWLGKAHRDEALIDVIYCSGNGVAVVDDVWFEHAPTTRVLGVEARLTPAEEMIWSKAFIMERERFDGADVLHVLHAQSRQLDWRRLLRRFDRHWRVLYVHLILFGFVYPSERKHVPSWVMDELAERLARDQAAGNAERPVHYGALLSRAQYLTDLERGDYEDGRHDPDVFMTPDDIALWTRVIADEVRPYARAQGDDPHRRGR